MKKLFIVLAVASFGFAACNNEADSTASKEDSIKKADSIRQAWVKDSLAQEQAKADAAAKAKEDSAKMADSLNKLKKK